MKIRGQQIFGLLVVIVFGARMVLMIGEKDRKEKEMQELLQSLPSPSELPMPEYTAPEFELESISEEVRAELDSIGKVIESMSTEPIVDPNQ